MKKYLLGIYLLAFSIVVNAHPYYVTISEINFNRDNKSLEISTKIFVDDFEIMLEKSGKKKMKIGDEKEHRKANEVIFEYINNHFNIQIKNINQELFFVGKEVEGGEMYVYLEMKNVEEFNSIVVKNDILIETFPEQVNIIHFTKDNVLKTERLIKTSPKVEFNFE